VYSWQYFGSITGSNFSAKLGEMAYRMPFPLYFTILIILGQRAQYTFFITAILLVQNIPQEVDSC
jgi:hypothetical protein